MRLFILFIAPPGFSKSTFLQHLLRPEYGVLAECGVETFFKAYMTEAALVGSFAKSDKVGEMSEIEGFLKKNRNSIVGIEEFSSLLTAARQEHSMGLDSALLDWFTHGEIHKDLRSGEISFKTHASLFAGTQLGRERIELRGGMARRFFFILWVPNEQDEASLKEATIDSPKFERLDEDVLKKLRTRINNVRERLDSLEGLYFTDQLNDYFREHLAHNEIPLFRRLAIGYAIMKEDFSTDLKVGIDAELRRLMDTALLWRKRIYREISEETGLGTDMVIQILERDNPIVYDDLAKKLLLYEVSFEETDSYLKKLENQRRISIFNDKESGKVMVRLIG